MVAARASIQTVGFIDDYCHAYRSLFNDVRLFECFKYLHLGMLSEIPRKSLPEIAKATGLKDGQRLNHFLRSGLWKVEQVRETRLWLTKLLIGEQAIILCIDETGDTKKGKTTDYVSRQYIGNIGKTDNGIVSVNAYAVVEEITYPLIFKIFKPRKRLKESDEYKTKTQLAVEILQELKQWGFKIKLVLADSLYGESGNVIAALNRYKLKYIVAIRSNHGVLLGPGEKVRRNRWLAYEQKLSRRCSETRYIREIIFGKRRVIRYYQISKKAVPDPTGEDSWYIMTNLEGKIQLKLAPLYSLRNWIEYSFKQVKNELGWRDFRLTDYQSIERWWELVMSAYLLVSIQANYFKLLTLDVEQPDNLGLTANNFELPQLQKHSFWTVGTSWKSAPPALRFPQRIGRSKNSFKQPKNYYSTLCILLSY
ncbi:MAG: IS701 family transposase [Xenococcus sp. MO_188.B8]|nr:IS701 family transposase [Xenococcus sp. MO_188.B8]